LHYFAYFTTYSTYFGFDTMIMPRALREGELGSSCDQSCYEYEVAQAPNVYTWWDLEHDFGVELMLTTKRIFWSTSLDKGL